jgi:hypothetical protein
MTRTFEDKPATRERTPLIAGIVGPSASGKTFSALRLATGFQRVSGGDIHLIDTEARRSLHYADKFKFRHVAFGAPFSPTDYLAAIEHCVKRGAGTVVIDSMSHEHEGPGGVLEMHAAETARLAKLWKTSEDTAKMSAWGKPKSERRRLINSLLQMECNFIFCFRAKPKLKIVRGKQPEQLGFMPIAGEDFVYEMVVKFLLLPGANGVPVTQSEYEGERMMIKVPEQFRALLSQPRQLTEDTGEALARWAAGVDQPTRSATEIITSYAACSDAASWRALEIERKAIWGKASKADKEAMKAASDEVDAFLRSAASGGHDQSTGETMTSQEASEQP